MAAIFPGPPGSQDHPKTILNSHVWRTWLPVYCWPPSQFDLRIPQLSKICMINSSTWQRKEVANKPPSLPTWEIYSYLTFPVLGSSPTWISAGWFLIYPALTWLVLRMALMTYESNLHCGFNVVSLRNEPSSFKPDREAMWSFSKFTFPFDERKVVTFAKITVTQYIIIRYFAYSSFSITYLTCTWDKHSIDSLLFYEILQLLAFLYRGCQEAHNWILFLDTATFLNFPVGIFIYPLSLTFFFNLLAFYLLPYMTFLEAASYFLKRR